MPEDLGEIEVTEEAQEPIVTSEEDFSADEFEASINSILEELSNMPSTDEEITEEVEEPRPSNFISNNEESEDFISEDELEEFEQAFDSLEERNTELEKTLADINEALEAQKNEYESQIGEFDSLIKGMEDAYSRITSHPVIGEYAKQLAEGKEINIPSIIKQHLDEGLGLITNVENAETIGGAKIQQANSLEEDIKSINSWGNTNFF